MWTDRIAGWLEAERALLKYVEAPFLTFVRLYWGYGFAVSGWGKLSHIDDVAAWFGGDLGIPLPYANAVAAATTELVGGVLLFVGLGSRLITVPLAVVMTVAFLTSDFGGIQSLWMTEEACKASETCVPFEEAAPFSYLWAALIVMLWGPGPLSADALIRSWTGRSAGRGGPNG